VELISFMWRLKVPLLFFLIPASRTVARGLLYSPYGHLYFPAPPVRETGRNTNGLRSILLCTRNSTGDVFSSFPGNIVGHLSLSSTCKNHLNRTEKKRFFPKVRRRLISSLRFESRLQPGCRSASISYCDVIVLKARTMDSQ
jgi:hypothetical protein